MRKLRSTKGFTFLELAIVITLLGLVSFLTVPRLQVMLAGNSLERASRNLATIIRYARGLTAGEGTGHLLYIDIEQNRYWLSRVKAGAQGSLEPEEVMERKRLPDSVSFKDVETLGGGLTAKGEAIIHFWTNGLVEMSSIHLENEKGHRITLVINPITGSVVTKEGYVRQKIS